MKTLHRIPTALLVGVLLIMPAAWVAAQDAPELAISTDFEGGNAELISIDQEARSIVVKPLRPPDKGWGYWWYLRVDGLVPGETLELEVRGIHGRFAHPEQAAFSTDGVTWQQTPRGERNKEFITYRVKVDAQTAWFAWGPPFVPKDARALVERLSKAAPWAEAFELAKSRDGHSVPGLRIAQQSDETGPRYGVWIQARQHAWEAGSSSVAQGFAEWLVSDDPRAVSLRAMAEVTLVPIMDMDSVAKGLGGKAQKPHDHNRDWGNDAHWPEVQAAMEAIWARKERMDVFIDLHSPGMWDPESFYLISQNMNATAIGRRNLKRFLAASYKDITGPLTLKTQHKTAGPQYTNGWQRMGQNWVTTVTPEHVVALTLETAWNNPDSTAEGYQAMGRQLGLAIERYLREDPREPVAAETE